MKIVHHPPPEKIILTIEEFADLHSLEMHVYESETDYGSKYRARFEGNCFEIDNGKLLEPEFGYGDSIEKAIAEFSWKISKKNLKVNGVEMKAPEIVYKKEG